MRKMSNKDMDLLYDYISEEPEYNLFIYGDIEAYGLENENLDIWCFEKDGFIDSILMRFKEYYIPYSKSEKFNVLPVVEKLKELKAKNISGKKYIMDRISLEMPQLVMTETHLARLNKQFNIYSTGTSSNSSGSSSSNIGSTSSNSICSSNSSICLSSTAEVKTAKPDDLEEITQFYCEIGEFDTNTRYQRSLERSREYLKTGTGRFFYMRTDEVISAVAATTAENSKSAMIVGVATAFKYRNKGFATVVLKALCNEIFDEGKEFLCLFYYNLSAGRIYERIGFREIGIWTMGKM